jgi:hypothetical protein
MRLVAVAPVVLVSLVVSLFAVAWNAPPASACLIIGAPQQPYAIQPNHDCSNVEIYYGLQPDVAGEQTLAGNLGESPQAEESEEHKDVPWLPILIGAFVIPTAVLVIPSFFMGKRKAEDDDTGPRG